MEGVGYSLNRNVNRLIKIAHQSGLHAWKAYKWCFVSKKEKKKKKKNWREAHKFNHQFTFALLFVSKLRNMM